MEKDYKEHVIDNIAAIRIAMLTTSGADDHLHSRPMYTLEIDDNSRLWFYTHRDTLKTHELNEQHAVNVAYADLHNHTYISISGRANELDDKERADELWDPALEVWFPNGPGAEDVRLLVVEMEQAAFWDSKNSVMKNGIIFKEES